MAPLGLRRTRKEKPLDLHRMPPFALRRGDALVVESAGDVSRRHDALLAQCVDGGLYEYEGCRFPWIDVVHLVPKSESVGSESGADMSSDK
jgi:hypothetical protein